MTWFKFDDRLMPTKWKRRYYGAVPVVPCVYALYDREGLLIYIGSTTSLQARMRQHRPTKLSHVKYKPIECEAMRKDLERRLIRRLQPEWNIVDTPRHRPGQRRYRAFTFTRKHW